MYSLQDPLWFAVKNMVFFRPLQIKLKLMLDSKIKAPVSSGCLHYLISSLTEK